MKIRTVEEWKNALLKRPDGVRIACEYCEWKRNLKFPEQINNPHNIPGTELISCTNFCPCCGKRIKIID